MAYSHRIDFIRQKTLALMAIAGDIFEDKGAVLPLLQKAKDIAKEMAEELNMPEAVDDWLVLPQSGHNGPRNLAICVGRLAKVCEAFDHIEAFSYRETLELNIRGILHI